MTVNADWRVFHDQPVSGGDRDSVLGDEATRDGADAARAGDEASRLGQFGRQSVAGAVDVRQRVQHRRVVLQRDDPLRGAPHAPSVAPRPLRRRRTATQTARRQRRRTDCHGRRVDDTSTSAETSPTRTSESGRDDAGRRGDELDQSQSSRRMRDRKSASASRDPRVSPATLELWERGAVERRRRRPGGVRASGKSTGAACQPRTIRGGPVVAGTEPQCVRRTAIDAVVGDVDSAS